jgi:hypothetical protein
MTKTNGANFMSGKRSRDKGLNFEREIAKIFREELGYENARRHLEYNAIDAKGYDLDDVGPFKVQCKRLKQWAPISKIEEVQLEDHEDIEMLVTKGDKKPIMAVLPFRKLIALLKKKNEEIAYLKGLLRDKT